MEKSTWITISKYAATAIILLGARELGDHLYQTHCEEYRDLIGKPRKEQVAYIQKNSPSLGLPNAYDIAKSLDDCCE